MKDAGAHSSQEGRDTDRAEAEVRRRIADRGRIPFAEFMEIALYHPSGGYYSRRPVLSSGDYFTSSAAHPAFGALLAVQAERAWDVMGRPRPFHVVEMGAGQGLMARDLVQYAHGLSPEFADALSYVALDRGGAAEAFRTGPFHALLADGLPLTGITGLLISNELLDAMPVHRFQIRSGRVCELFVALDESGKLVDQPGEPSTPRIVERLSSLGAPLPEGFVGEVNLGIGPWMRQVVAGLSRGFVITIDYGHEAPQLYSEARNRGTLHTYFRHTEGAGPYRRIGSQDITAHVDFTAVVSEGASVGLRSVALLTQAEYLKALGWSRMVEGVRGITLSSYERDANLMALRELVKPEGLGGFKVMVQEKGTGIRGLEALTPSPDRIECLATPLLSPEHVPLYAGRYPSHDPGLEALWPFGAGGSQGQGPGPV
jgi:SAM-dependent MidA family methyltransferase